MDQAKYAELFRTESREQLAELDTALLAYEQSADAAHVATLFRGVHTIKGMAASMGYGTVEQLSHVIESLLDGLRSGVLARRDELIPLLFEGTDALRASIEAAVSGDGVGTAVAPETAILLARLRSVGSEAGAPQTAGETPRETPRRETTGTQANATNAPNTTMPVGTGAVTVDVRLTPDCPLKGVRAMLVRTRLEALGQVTQVVPPASSWNSELFDGAFVITLTTEATPAALESAARAAGDVARVTVAAVTTNRRREAAAESMRTVRVDRRRLDTLLDLVGELVITRDRLLHVAEASDQSSTRLLTRTAHETARLISALQDEVLQARMVPVGQVFDRFPRLVRDIARDLDKDVEFVTEGREIELDRSLLDAIGDPLVHLLRNALDHGIENRETRAAHGKSPTGTLILRAVRDRAAVVLQVEDDGRGIDRRAILRRAVHHGLVPEGTTTLDDDTLLQVLAHAGFSTAQAVTAISGRGVGVDVVATRVRALGGVLEVETIEGQGTVFTLRLPLTLAITRALLVQVADETYALPAAHVVEALEYDPGTRVTTAAREAVNVRGETVPLVRAREHFGHPRDDADSYLAVIEVAGRRSAIMVDALVAQQDIVVKPFDAVRGAALWFSGATVLGDGTPALIVDLGSLT